ncbi:MAG: amino acid ABC transporter permease [Geminicoccaceae bacterium]
MATQVDDARYDTSSAPTKPPFWRDPRARALIVQGVFLAVVLGTIFWLINNTMSAMERQGIASGFGFLNSEAGFSISQTLISYDQTNTYGRVFIVGLLNTLLVSACGIVLATILGFIIGIARLSDNWLISRLAAVYVEIFRNIPLLLQIFFWYFAVLRQLPQPRDMLERGQVVTTFSLNNRGLYVPKPLFGDGIEWVGLAFVAALVGIYVLRRVARAKQMATGKQMAILWPSLGMLIGLPLITYLLAGVSLTFDYPEMGGFRLDGGLLIIPEFVALLVALSVYTASFIAEIVRAGILAVNRGQTEAAFALGLRPGPTLRLIIVPQAMRVIIPPLTSQYLNLTKNSSLAAAVAYPDLVSQFAGTVLNQTGQAIEVMAMTLAVYLTLSLTISFFMNWYNARSALVER